MLSPAGRFLPKKTRKHNIIRIIYAVKQNCLPLLNHFLPWFHQSLTFKCFHNFSCLPVDAQAPSHELSRRQWMHMVVNTTRFCCFPKVSVSGSVLGPDPHSRPVLLLRSFGSSRGLPAHTEHVCLSFILQPFLPPSTSSSYSSHSPAFLLLMTQTPDLLPLKLFFLDLRSPSASSSGGRINTTDSANSTATE